MPSQSTTLRAAISRTYRRILPWALALAVATCADDQNGPSRGGVGYFAFKPVYGVSNSLSQFGVVADSVHVLLTRPVNQVVLDTTVFFSPDSAALHLALPVQLQSSPESLSAVIEISAGGTVIFVDSVDVEVTDGPPSPANIPTVTLTYVGPGKNVAAITLAPGDTTIFLGDTLFFSATAIDSSDAPVASFYTAWKTSDSNVAKINAQGRLIAPNLRGSVQVIGYTPTGIADTTVVTFAPVPVIVTADSGDAQSGLAGDSLAALFVARVKGADSLGISGIAVRFAAVTAGGAVRDTFTLVTDVNGRVRTRGVLGTTTGTYNYTATVAGSAISRTFSATASPGAASAIALIGGNTQTDSAGRVLPSSLVVQVTDAFGNPVSGAKVYWTRIFGTGAVSADSVLTSGGGNAAIQYTLGAPGTDSIRATLAGTSATVTFVATSINGAAATVSKVFGDAQTDTVGRLLTDSMIVTVRSATTQPVVGATVTWTVVRGGSTSSATTLTDAAGKSAVAYTLGTLVGVDSVTAQVGAASATFTATAVNGVATTLAISSGNAQTDTTGTLLPLPLVVHATDTFGNSVGGTGVLFQRTAGNGTLAADTIFTDGAGLASVGYTLGGIPGTDSVSATLLCACSSVTFTATAIPAAPASIITVQGGGQTVTVNTVADTFAVLVRDGASKPVAGVKVNWAFIPAQGSFTEILPAGIQQSFTDSVGVARGIYTTGTQAGTVRVEAQVAAIIDSIFITAVPAAPSAIAVQSGDAQVDTAGHPLALPFLVRVADAFNNPVPAAKVYWTRVVGGGLVTADSTVTDASGITSVNYVLGPSPSTDTVTATIAGTSTFATFSATGVDAAPASIQAFGGDLQGDSAGKTIAPLVAIVRDGSSNPIVGTPVVWTVIRGGSLSVDTVLTNASGLAQVTYTLGTAVGIDSVRAQAGSATVIFTEAVINGAAATIAVQSGNNQTDTLGHAIALPFVVRVADAYNNPVSGSKVAFTRVAGSGSLFADTLTTDASGLASVGYLFGLIPGSDTIRADLIGTGANVNFVATAVPGVAAALNPVSGGGQADTALAALAAPMILQVLDAQGRQVPGAIVSFTGTGGLKLTQAVDTADLSGDVSVGITLGDTVGTWSVTATVVAVPALQVTDSFTVTPGSASQIAILGGDGQTDTLGKALALPFVVRVTDASGNDVAGAPVIFTVTAGGGTLTGDTVLTSAAGQASIGYTLGATPGTNTVHAALGGTAAFVDFTSFAVNAFPTSITAVSGGGQSAAVTAGFTDSLDVVVKDAALAPIVNGMVIWSVSGGGLTLTSDTTFTDALGHTNVRVTAGTTAGAFTVFAQAVGLAPTANFSLTVTAGGVAHLVKVSGDLQTGVANTRLPLNITVRSEDAYGNAVGSADLTFKGRPGSGYALPDSGATDGVGLAAVGFYLGPIAGEDTIVVKLVAAPDSVIFTATAVNAAPASIVATQGDGQTGTVGVTLPTPLVATVKDSSSNPIVGTGVVWTALNGGSLDVDTTFTNGTGQVAANYTMGTLAGTDSVQATTLTGGLIATFTFTATAGVASQIAVQSGDGQVDTTGRALPLPFTAVVYDAYNNPVAGQTVLFSVITGSGTFSVDSVVTDTAGLASTTYTLGTTPGLEDVRATLKGTSAFIDFYATTVSGAPALIAKILGDAQTDTVLSTLADSLVVELQDAGNTPIPNSWIYWQTAGATVSADSTLTGADGRAAVSVTFDNVAIPIVVLARNVDTTLGAVFNLRATAGTPTQITEVAGNGQTGAINDTLPIDFRVLLQDAYNNPAQAGVAVTWTNLVGFQPAGLPDTTVTDTTGIATLIKPLLSNFVGADSLVAQILGKPDSVIFTATTNAGAAASLVYVGGTGQTDTVGRSLSAPMVVQLRDAGNNPVVGAWVQWKLISGGGALPLDSTQTDGTGAASSSLTMGTVAGLDSVRATFAGVTDTVVFYALAENDTATAIAIISGDGQSATVGSAVPLPVVAELHDQYGNGVDGVPVTFAPSGSGGVANPSVATDANGQASSGTWTLDTLAGTNTLIAAAGALNKTAGAFALPIGTSKYWNGLTSTDWNTAANWSPAGVPTASDNVFIPVSQPAPVLSANAVANDLTLQGGGSVDIGSDTLTVNGSLFEGGAIINGGGFVILAGSGTLDQLNAGALTVNGSYALTSGAVAQVGYLQIDPTGTLDLNGHALTVNGNVRQDGALVMKAGSDSLDVLGNLDVTSVQTGAGNLTNGVIVLRGGLTQSGATDNFQPTTNLTTVFVGAGQNVDFQYPDSTNNGSGSYFNIVRFTDSTNFTSSVAFRGTVTVDTGKKVTSAGGTTAGLNAALIGDVYADWSFNNTRFWATPASVPDSLRGSLEFFNSAVTLTKPLAVGGALRVSDNSNLTLNGNWVRVDSAFHSSGTGQVTMTNAADSLDISGTATIDGGPGSFQDGVLVLRSDLSVPGASAVFQATGTHRTRFAGGATQQVAFASPSLATNRFNTVEFDNAAGVNFNSDAAVEKRAEVKLGQVTGPGTISLSGDLVDTTNNAWRPEFTVRVSGSGLLPARLARNLELRDTTTLGGGFTVGSSLVLSGNAFLDVNGHTLTVDSNLVLFGGAALLQMTNAADSVDVGFSTSFDGADESGHLTAGVLALRGDLAANQATPTFVATGSHRTLLVGTTHTLSFPFSTGWGGNHFQDLEIPSGGSVINAFTDLYVNGTFKKAAGPTGTVQAPSQVQLQAHGLAVDNLNFDKVRVVYSGPSALQFDNVKFLTEDSTLAQLQLDLAGGQVTLNNTYFQVKPSTGAYVAVADTVADASTAIVDMYRSQPLDGSAHEFEIAGNDGATINWSRMVFATQPTDAAAGATLPAFRVAVLNPAGDTATWYGNAVTVAIGVGTPGALITGTDPVTAVSGIATFSDIAIDSAGFGYTLNAVDTAGGIGPVSSLPFNMTVAAPVGFDAVWYGITSNDWTVASNWSTGVVPDSTTNVFIAAGTPNTATVLADTVFVKRLRVAPTATINVSFGKTLVADSSVEAGGGNTGGGTIALRGTGEMTGDLGNAVWVTGTYAVKGTAAASDLEVLGDLTVAADTLNVSFLLQTQSNGKLNMVDPAALVYVAVTAGFNPNTTSSGNMSEGILRIGGNISSYGGVPNGFTPSGNMVTEFVGSGDHVVDFYTPDSLSSSGSHFANMTVNGTGRVVFTKRIDVLGQLQVLQGTLADSLGQGLVAHQGVTLASGTTLTMGGELRSGGAITVAGGATYSVPVTTYYGAGAPLAISALPYDTLQVQRAVLASEDLTVPGDLRISGTGAGLDLNGHTVAVGHDVNIQNGANLTMQNSADLLNVAGSFFTNGDSTKGLLTDGTLQIAGDFRQAADGSGESFRASGNHTTRFTGGAGMREIKFDSPSTSPTDLGGSHFAILDLPDGIDSINGRVPAEVSLSVGASITYDTIGGGNELATYGPLDILASSDSIHIQTLETWGGLTKAGAGIYQVGLTRLWGGSGTLPALPYTDLSIAHTAYTMGADQTIAGNLLLGIFCSELCTSSPGELTVGGHTLTVGDQLQVLGLGLLTMGAADSVDVTGDLTFRGAPSNGHLTGGTLVARALFNTVGTDAFQADAAHRTILTGSGVQDIYPSANIWFGKLYLLGDERRIRSSSPVVVLDSLVLGSATAALSDTAFGANNGQLVAQGPILTVNSSAITLGGSMRIDVSAPQIFGSYSVGTTILGGTGQTVPNLTYGSNNIQVIGTAQLGSALDIGGGSFTVDGSAGPADIDLNGQTLQVGDFTVAGNGTLTSTTPASALLVRGNATFNGGDETGRLTEGGATFKGFFTQDTLTSQASYFSSGNHTTVFADSSFGGSQAVLATMFAGQSRFNNVDVYGRGVLFFGQGWVGGDLRILDPGVDSVGGGLVTIGGGLVDSAYKWKVDSTWFLSTASELTALPDSIDGNVTFAGNHTLADLFRVGGELRIEDTVTVNGYTIAAHNGLKVTGPGVLRMLNPTDDVVVDGQASFEGAPTAGLMDAGRLTLHGDFVSGMVTPGVFEASGSHVTVFNGGVTQSITFGGGAGGFNDVVTYNDLTMPNGAIAHGTFRDSVTTGTLTLSGNNNPLWAWHLEMTGAQINDLPLQIGEQSQLDTVSITFTDPSAVTQIAVEGAGQAAPLDLHAITFNSWAGAPQLVRTIDTLTNGQGVHVRMFGSTPFDGSTETYLYDPADPGLSSVTWSHLALSGPLPATVDSAIPFNISVVVKEPDGTNRADVIGIPAISLAANPAGATLSVGSVSAFDGQSANINNVSLDKPGAGVSFLIEMQGRAIDSFTTPTLDVINPAPAGAVVFDGGAGDGLWSSALNWSTNVTPATTDTVFIPGGMSVTLDQANDTVGTLVLGTGAALNLGGNTLVTTGNVYAGQTITSGTLEIAGAASQISGTLPTLHITGSATAVGPTSIVGDLIVSGATAEFNVGGQKVDVSGTLFTQTGGLFTMDGLADTLSVSTVSLAGGDETGRLTNGVLFIHGSGFDQQGGDPHSFYATGNHTTVFDNTGGTTAVNISDPANSQFASVQVLSPNSVDFNESGLGRVRLVGNLTLTANAVVTGDTLEVFGTFTAGSVSNLTLNVLSLVNTPTLDGTYNVANTVYTGPGVSIPAAPGGYQTLTIAATTASLAGPVDAVTASATGGDFSPGGNTLHAKYFSTQGSGRLVMTNALDTLIVDSAATFGGQLEDGMLTDGAVILGGSLDARAKQYHASGNHLTRFVGTSDTVYSSPNGYCEGGCDPLLGVWFGRMEATNATVVSVEPMGGGLKVEGNAILTNSTIGGGNASLFVQGDLTVDATSTIQTYYLTIGQRMDLATGATFDVNSTYYIGPASHVTAAPYQQLFVIGAAVLDTAVTSHNLTLQGVGTLTMAGHTLTVDTDFVAQGNSHLVMNDDLDSLHVGQTATFEADSTEGDFTAGGIRAADFEQLTGPLGSTLSFVQTGTNRIVPQANDTISMDTSGPTDSRLKSIDFSSAGGQVVVYSLFATDTVLIADLATSVTVGTDNYIGVGMALVQTNGNLATPYLELHGTLDHTAGIFAADTTLFAGTGQVIPSGVPYAEIIVQGDATLAGDIDLRTGGHSLRVENSGDLDLAGHTLQVVEFKTEGFGRLTMHSPIDSLIATSASFYGDSTNLSLTDGTITTQFLDQQVGGSGSNKSYAPTGAHRLVLADLGSAGDGVGVNFQTPGFDSSHANVLVDSSYGMLVNSPIVVNDTLLLNVPVNSSPNMSITAYGPAIFGAGVTIGLDTLIIHDTLVVDPAATYNVNSTVFAPGASPAPGAVTYNNVIIEGGQTLAVPLTLGGELYVRGGGMLTPAGKKVLGTGGFHLQDNARLVMASGDTLDMGSANFAGAASGADLAGGILRIRNGLYSGGATSQSFAPTGMVTEFYGGGLAVISLAVVSPSNSYIDTLRVIEGTFVAPSGDFLAMAPAVLKDGSIFDGNSSSSALDFRKGLAVLDSSKVEDAGSNTIFFGDSLTVANPGNYSVFNTRFNGTAGIPDLPYQGLIIDGVQTTLTHRIAASGQLQIVGSTPGATKITLGGHTVSAGTLDISGYARVEMNDPNDTLRSAGNMTFSGEDESGLLTSGFIRVGADLAQGSGFFSTKSLRIDGAQVEFYGASNHVLSFANPGTSLSYIGDVSILGGGKLYDSTAVVFNGRVDVGTSATLDLGLLTAANSDFYGPVTVASLGKITNLNTGAATFHDTLLVDPAATYNVVNTAFQDIDTIPDLTYQNLYLWNGTDAVLGNDITTAGSLSVDAPTGSASLTLNGHSVNVAGQFTLNGDATLVMTNPADQLFVTQNANFGGGNESGLLTAGTLQVGGDFFQTGASATSFVADSGHTTTFGGTGTHQVSFSTPTAAGSGGSHFGSLSFTTDAGVVLNVMSDIWAEGTLTTTAGSTPTLLNGAVPLRTLTARDVNIDGITFDHVQFHLAKTTGVAAGAGSMNGVTFQNFLNTEDQFVVDLPGEAGQYSWGGFTFTQLNTGDSGHYLVATDTDGITPNVLDISLGTNNWGVTDPPFYVGLNGAVVSPFAP